jgi:uncharacterized peroxidase-related enzyme
VVHHGAALTAESGQAALTEAVASGRMEKLSGRLSALLRYALKLTLSPWDVAEDDLAPLRASGLTDRDIVDANQVVAYFNYVNRVADGLGVKLESRWPAQARRPRRYGIRQQWLSANKEARGQDGGRSSGQTLSQ